MSLIEGFLIKKSKSGIVTLIFKCNQKEVYYHDYNDNTFSFWSGEGEDNPELVEIKEFKIEGLHIRSSLKEKDQIIFYYIPKEML
jgi:hypothetical protein